MINKNANTDILLHIASLFVRLSVHPKLAVTLFLDFDPVIDAVGGEDEGGLLRVAVTHC